MKFSESTMAVLKNYSEINPNVLMKAGNVLTTIAPSKQILSKAVLEDSIPSKAPIYDLSRFLSTVTLFDDPDVDFKDDRFQITSNDSNVAYTFAAENMILIPPKDELDLPDVLAKVDIPYSEIKNAQRVAGILSLPELQFKSEMGKLMLIVCDSKNPNSDNFKKLLLEDDSLTDFNVILNVENLKFLPFDYTVSISSGGIVHFKGGNVEYWVAAQSG